MTLRQNFIRNKQGHFLMIKWSIPQEHKTVINAYSPKIRAPEHRKET